MDIYEVAGWAFLAVSVIPTWRIFARVGQQPALALLRLIPGLGPILVLYILAFCEWPKFQNGDKR